MDPTSRMMLMGAAGSGAVSYWIVRLSSPDSGQTDRGYGIAIDSSGNSYITGYSSDSSSSTCLVIAKYNPDGIIQWQRTLESASSDYGYDLAVDSNGNVYIVGVTRGQGAGLNDLLIAKYDTSGVIQWQRTLGTTNDDVLGDQASIDLDSSANVYVSCSSGDSPRAIIIAKYNSSGTIQWQRKLVSATNTTDGGGLATVSGNGNVYVTGAAYIDATNGWQIITAKYDTSGTLQWQKTLGGTASEYGYGVAVDSNENVYVVGQSTDANAFGDFQIAKYNSSGTIQWQRRLGGTATQLPKDIAVDANANVYIIGSSNSEGGAGYNLFFAKYNTSGTLQWQRSLGTSNQDYGHAIVADSVKSIYVVGFVDVNGSGINDFVLAKLPDDGTKTGTYGSFVYAARTLTDASTSLTDASSSRTSSTSTYTSQTSTLTDAASTFTSTKTTV